MIPIPTILIIDDDPDMSAGLRDNLEVEGYHVVVASTLKQGHDFILQQYFNIVLLDLMLPDGSGISFCRQLRQQGFTQPIIMLTARSEEMDKVLGFEVGADDYVVKPFSLRELLARVQAHLRRKSITNLNDDVVHIGVAIADFKRHQLTRNSVPLEVSAKEMDLLRFLCAYRGLVISRDTLLTELWGHQGETVTRTVDNFIVRLRKKIEPEPTKPYYLITVHGSGYKLIEQ